MSRADRPKLSLLAQFDDIVRCNAQLTAGIEDDFLRFATNQNECREKWMETLRENDSLRFELLKAKKDKDLAETKIKHIKRLIDAETQKRLKVESEKKALERQISLIKEVLLADQSALNDQAKEKLAFLNNNAYTMQRGSDSSPRRLDTIEESMGSLFSASDVSFDKTDEDLDNEQPVYSKTRRTRSKRSSTQRDKSAKKQKLLDENSVSADSEEKFESNGREFETVPRRITRSTRCYSEPAPPPAPLNGVSKLDNDPFGTNDVIIVTNDPLNQGYTRSLSSNTPLRRLSSIGRMNRAHVFCTKTVIRPETCLPCGRRIRFYKQALKCQDCRATCHPECKDKVPLPCFPTVQTPTNKGTMGTIADYAPSTPPMIPALIIHCINEIEDRGLSEVGLYRISGSEREVKDLKEKFLKGKCVPCMSKIDIHAVCGTVKEFLRSTLEPLVTRALWKTFVEACCGDFTDTEKFQALYQAISQLPQPNRDTMAFLISHLQNVANSPKCKMPIENLAKVFGPTVIGYSAAEPADGDLLTQTSCQFNVMLLLLKIPEDYWRKFFCLDEDIFNSGTPELRPEPRSAPEGNMLGPISSCGGGYGSGTYRSPGIVLGKTSLTPRNVTGSIKTKRQFFTSPLLK